MRVVWVNGNGTIITFDNPAISNHFGITPVYTIGIFVHPQPMIILHEAGLHIDITKPCGCGVQLKALTVQKLIFSWASCGRN